VCDTYYKQVLFQAALTLGFQAFLRVGEKVPSSRASKKSCLHIGDVTVTDSEIIVTFRRFKSSGTQSFRLQRREVCCPLVAVNAYLAQGGRVNGLQFAYPSGSPVYRREFDAMPKAALVLCGFDPTRFKGHSSPGAEATLFMFLSAFGLRVFSRVEIHGESIFDLSY
jgi:hypothetical protein